MYSGGVRFALLTLLASCQLVFPFEGESPQLADCVAGNDEDCDDICPVVSRLDTPGGDQDLDGDGLGEGCDPTPAKDRIVFFDGFASNRTYDRFEGVLSNGRARFGDRSGFLLDRPVDRLVIRVGFEIVRQTATPGGFGIVFGARLAPAATPRGFDGNFCQPYKTHGDSDVFEFEHWEDGVPVSTSTNFVDWVAPDMMLDGFAGTLELDVSDRLTCSLVYANGAEVLSDDRRVEPAGVGLWTFGSEVVLDYLMVVERGD
jgi:hypothetical protein